ncbi:MAG: excinuclease ABC subunit C [Rhodospirillaceae bacterium]|jgi:excinuclease ABC subunit C|nr:excinuclease ABC subunit C [Rhodospirillaceae bacterium]|tara:strand:- start:3006 stop:4940 length:1935 start_codon:yes stop_codon:yes gene_type:complete
MTERQKPTPKAAKFSSAGVTAAGATVIEGYLKTLPGAPGVYRMINTKSEVLYVGKAKNLKKRVASYTRPDRQPVRTRRMIAETASMEFVTTHTEAEALLLESNLIKRYRPRYNILLRDDKSFPSILLTGDHAFPQVLKHRGAESRKGDYYGPFASVWAVNEALATLQRAFLLRSCTDTVFANRTRPCLLHQIKRCSAPCVGRISEAEYRASVEHARAFLTGGSRKIQRHFARLMQDASDAEEYEKAAGYRDRIRALTRIQAHQDINLKGVGDADVIGVHQAGGQTCIQVFFFRAGANFGNRAYFPSHARDEDAAAVLEAFLGQFYAKALPPKTVFVSHPPPNRKLLAEALSVRAGRTVRLVRPQRGDKRNLVNHVLANAREALARRMAESASQRRLLEGLAQALDLDGPPERIEVFDNSHVSGAKAVGALIVAGPEGLMKKAYRKFTIRGARQSGAPAGNDGGFSPGDDYAMMREVLSRRFSRALKEDSDRTAGTWPDLVLVDGGKGHLGVALEVFEDLGIEGVTVAAIAKGPDSHAGRERIYLPGREPLTLPPRDPVLFFLQRLRDEAHRFAIGAHRDKRSKSLVRSLLDDIPSIGAKRKKALLHHFGAAKAVAEAGRADLEAVDGISKATANRIYEWFHPDG